MAGDEIGINKRNFFCDLMMDPMEDLLGEFTFEQLWQASSKLDMPTYQKMLRMLFHGQADDLRGLLQQFIADNSD